MKPLYLAAALLMASTAAYAGNSVTFEVDGKKVHVEVPKNCNSLSCVQISGLSGTGFNLKGLKVNRSDDDDADSPTSANTTPAPPIQASTPATQPAAPQTPPPAVNNQAQPTTTTTTTAPALQAAAPASSAPAPAVAPAPQPATMATAPAPTTPIGIWATEEDKGNVRIEQCGPNLCGYAVGTGEKVLINMMPAASKWTGQIHDPDSGRDYDSTIAMKGPNILKVQGCAFGGLFCGGQTWKRVS